MHEFEAGGIRAFDRSNLNIRSECSTRFRFAAFLSTKSRMHLNLPKALMLPLAEIFDAHSAFSFGGEKLRERDTHPFRGKGHCVLSRLKRDLGFCLAKTLQVPDLKIFQISEFAAFLLP
jgi:hypothetical protein